MKRYIKILKNSNIFEGMSEADIVFVLAYLKPKVRQYKKRECLAAAGSIVSDIFILLQGKVEIVKESISGARTLIRHRLPVEAFGEAFSSIGAKCPVSAYAAEDSLVMLIPFENIMNMPPSSARLNLKMVKNMTRILARKCNESLEHLEHLSRGSLRTKLVSYLNLQKNNAGKNEFVIPISKTDLADFLLINRTSMYRELAAMKKENLISFKGRKFTLKTSADILDA